MIQFPVRDMIPFFFRVDMMSMDYTFVSEREFVSAVVSVFDLIAKGQLIFYSE